MKSNLNKIKAIILMLFVTLSVSFYFTSDFSVNNTIASIGGPPAGNTGAPGETNCTNCHNANGQTGQFSIIAPTNYLPGQTYTIQVRHATADTSRSVWGFELTSLTGTNVAAGTFTNSTANTRTRTANSRNYVEQNSVGAYSGQIGEAIWSFDWTAPATNVGAVTMYASGLQGDNNDSDSGDQTYSQTAVIQPATAVVIHHGFCDFDGDGKADPSVFRPSTGVWYINRSTSGFMALQFGIATDKLTPADFDGDDKADIAVWRPISSASANFYVFQSLTGTIRIDDFGITGDDPVVVGDWDGDGKADPAVYRDSAAGSQSYFYYRGSLNNSGGNITYLRWGTTGDKPMRGDFDGDGKQDLAVFRPSNATWYILQSSNGQARNDYWGIVTDKFVNADYDGDGKTDLAVFRGGTWYIKQSSNGQAVYFNWGLNTDVAVPADYDGDGKTDVAIYRNGVWYSRLSSTAAMSVQTFGLSTDSALPGAFVR